MAYYQYRRRGSVNVAGLLDSGFWGLTAGLTFERRQIQSVINSYLEKVGSFSPRIIFD